MSLYDKILAMKTGIENKTEKSFSTLTDAVQELADGYKQGGQEYLDAINRNIQVGGTYNIPNGIVTIPAYFYSSVWSGASNATTVVIPSTVKKIEERAFNYNFHNGNHRGNYVASEGIEKIGMNCFTGNGHASISLIPQSLKNFEGNNSMGNLHSSLPGYDKDIKLPNIESIGQYCFNGFNFGKNKVYLGNRLTSIGTSAFTFKGNPSITIYIALPEDSISGAPWGATNATIVWDWDGVTYYDD